MSATQQAGTTAQQAEQLYPTSNFLSAEVRSTSIAVLNKCLADIEVMQSQLKAAHWNVKGPNFFQLHELFEDLYEEFAEIADDVAERATTLGGVARGTVPVAARTTTLPEFPPTLVEEQAVLQQLAGSLSTLDAELYRSIQTVSSADDIDTVDLLNEVSREVSKALWFVEAHLQGPPMAQGPGVQGQGQMQQMQF
jgi:starvation-inducible DNA-binding protein